VTAFQAGNVTYAAAAPVVQSFNVIAAPLILGIENNASGATTGVSAGSLISIFGSQLATTSTQASTVPLPINLSGSSVSINNIPAPMYSTTPGIPGSIPAQINVQVPFDVLPAGTASSVSVVVTNNGNSSPPFSLPITQYAPAVYTINGSGTGYSIAYFGLTSDARFGHFVAPPGTFSGLTTYAASPGDVLTVYGTGLGPVNPPVVSGAAPDPNNPSMTVATPTVLVGGIPAILYGSALTQYPGVYQLNIQVPQGITAGSAVPLQLQMGSITSSNSTVIAVAAP
jgi:uncharacterized protein (TIGR03437 family)